MTDETTEKENLKTLTSAVVNLRDEMKKRLWNLDDILRTIKEIEKHNRPKINADYSEKLDCPNCGKSLFHEGQVLPITIQFGKLKFDSICKHCGVKIRQKYACYANPKYFDTSGWDHLKPGDIR